MKLKIKKLISITIVSMSVVISGIITVNATNQDMRTYGQKMEMN